MHRKAAVAGAFYPGSKDQLQSILKEMVPHTETKLSATAIISPHAGYIYSGKIAGELYSRVQIPDRVILLGPNHRGAGGMVSLFPTGSWETPLGVVNIDSQLSTAISDKANYINFDAEAHLSEHSLEVQVPFLQYFNPKVKITPLLIKGIGRIEDCLAIADILTEVVKEFKNTLIVASNDMTHFETEAIAKTQDDLAITKILDLDPEGLLETVINNNISMCGVIPVTIALAVCKNLKKDFVKVTGYTTSAEACGDFNSVVGYLGAYIT